MTCTWARSPRVLWRRVAGGVLLLPPGSEQVMAVTGSGATMWELLARPVDDDELARRLAETFDTTVDEARVATAPFLADLAAVGAVTKAP